MLLVALVPLLVMAIQGLHCAGQAIVALESTHQRMVLQTRRARINDWLAERAEELRALAAYPCTGHACAVALGDTTGGRGTACCDLLTYVRSTSHAYELIAIFGRTWDLVASSLRTSHVEDDDLVSPEFRRELDGATNAVTMPPHTHVGGEIGIHIGVSVADTNGVRAGYVVAAVNLSDTVYPILADSAGLRTTGKVYLLTRAGRYVSKPAGAFRLMTEEQGLPEEIVRGAGERVLPYRDFRGVRVLGTSVAMPRLGWVLVAEVDEAEAFGWLGVLRRRAIGTGLVTLCVVFALAFRSSRRLLVPLRRLSQTAQRIAAGHWQERVGHLRGAEPEEVGQAFNSMLDELAALQKRLVQSAALSAVGELSARVVHEMRNPLSSVKMNLKALGRKVQDDPTYAELAEIASGQADRLERMLTDLLQYGKPLELKKETLQFRELVEEVSAALAAKAESGGVAITIRDGTDGRGFAADREQIVRAVTNLVDNAIRVSPRDSSVQISGDVAGDGASATLVIVVRDAGAGMSEGVQEKLFKPFFTTRSDGTGLGLANVRKIAELHDGAVVAEDLPEGGAKFTLTLPVGKVISYQ